MASSDVWSSVVNTTESEFQTVSRRKKSKLRANKVILNKEDSVVNSCFNLESVLKRIADAKIEISSTDLYASVVASLKEGLGSLNNPKISEIICLGLGKIGECLTARYQFAIALNLRELFSVQISVYDPVFNEVDKEILSKFGINILTENFEGKHRVNSHETVLFFLPHCPKQLSNNLLWANWGLQLRNCVIISNSFSKIIESNTTNTLQRNARYLTKISPYVLELAIINSFKYFEIFNDTAVHVFPKLNLVCSDIWKEFAEPIYRDDDVEFVTKK